MLDIDNLLQLDEPDFTFGEDGDIIELTPGQHAPATPAAAGGAPMYSDAGASARVRQEHEEGQQGGAQVSTAAKSTLTTPNLYSPVIHLFFSSFHPSLTMPIHATSLEVQVVPQYYRLDILSYRA